MYLFSTRKKERKTKKEKIIPGLVPLLGRAMVRTSSRNLQKTSRTSGRVAEDEDDDDDAAAAEEEEEGSADSSSSAKPNRVSITPKTRRIRVMKSPALRRRRGCR